MKKNIRLKQLKFIATIFNYSLKEIEETLGFETLTMIMRRVGERTSENIVNRLKGRYSTIEDFSRLLINETMIPVIGENGASFEIDGDNVTLILNNCPYEAGGNFEIQKMGFFCHYTEGLIENAFRLGFPDKNLSLEVMDLKASGCSQCKFIVKNQ